MTARVPQRDRIQAVADFLGEQKRAGTAPAAIIAALVADHGASVQLVSSTNRLRVAGISVTCTWSKDHGLIDAWSRLAFVRLAQLDGRCSTERERAS